MVQSTPYIFYRFAYIILCSSGYPGSSFRHLFTFRPTPHSCYFTLRSLYYPNPEILILCYRFHNTILGTFFGNSRNSAPLCFKAILSSDINGGVSQNSHPKYAKHCFGITAWVKPKFYTVIPLNLPRTEIYRFRFFVSIRVFYSRRFF